MTALSHAEFSALVGQGGSVGAVTDEELNTLNDAIVQLEADVNVGMQKALQAHPPPDPESVPFINFQGDFITFRAEWAEWYTEHQTFLSHLGQDPEFAQWKSRYSTIHARWTSIGGKTSAPRSPGSLFPDIPWTTVLIVGGVVLGGYWLITAGGAAVLSRALRGG